MKRYPFVKQDDLKDCAAASLSMIIKYHHGYVPMEKLRNMLKLNKNGVSAYNIIKASEELGFESKGLKIKLEDLNFNYFPCIAHVTINNKFDHYVVIYEINSKLKKITIGDPSSKIKTISYLEFNKIYNNIIITFNRIRNIPIYSKEKNLSKYLLSLLKENKKYVIKLVILSIIILFISVISSFYFQLLIDKINNLHLLIKIFYLYLFIYLVYIFKNYLRNKILIRLNYQIDLSLTFKTFRKVILLPYCYFENRQTGDIIQRINDLSQIREILTKSIITITDMILIMVSGIILFSINQVLFIISFTMLILYLLIIILFKKILGHHIERTKEMRGIVNSYMFETISGFNTIKGLGIEKHVLNNFYIKYNNYLNCNLKLDNVSNLEILFKEIINQIGSILILFIGILFIRSQYMSLGQLITFNTLLIYFLGPIRNIIDLNTDYQKAKISLRRVQDLDYYNNENLKYLNSINKIEIRNLNYDYNDKKVLKSINLTINNNEKIMVIGNSGSGKSTLFKLIKKYYQNHCIYLNSINISLLDTKSINNSITYISQDEILFTDTLYNNLKLNRDISDDNVKEVSKICNIDTIMNYNFLIEENGFNISGGERQRIVLGRALLNKFDFLIIDEGLSQVDINLERKILKDLLKKYSNKTIIFVSHRYDNMDLFERVLKINNGNLEDIKKG